MPEIRERLDPDLYSLLGEKENYLEKAHFNDYKENSNSVCSDREAENTMQVGVGNIFY